MLVRDLMSRHPHYCTLQQRASDAACAMWTHAIGCVPVVDADRMPIGMVTDRVICIAAYRQNRRLEEIHIGDVMSPGMHTCMASDPVSTAARTMRDWHVQRLPVVESDGKLVGVLSLDDIVLARAGSWRARLPVWAPGLAEKTVLALVRRRAEGRRTRPWSSLRR